MKLDLVAKKVILEKKDCRHCQQGKVTTKQLCLECKGTGNGKRGGKGKCRKCHGQGYNWTWNNPAVCPQCNGNYVAFEDETLYDYLPKVEWNRMTFKVYRNANREMSWMEQHIGAGVFSCVDYGHSFSSTDEKVIADVMNHNGVQGIKVAKEETNELCDHIAIASTPYGYSVIPIYEKLA